MSKSRYHCPVCNGDDMTLRHEAGYVYSYALDEDAPGHHNEEEFLSYLYDRREQRDSRTYIQCNKCGTQYPYTFLNGVLEMDASSGQYR